MHGKIATHHSGQNSSEGPPQRYCLPNENRVWLAGDGSECISSEIVNGADHVVPSHEEGPPDNTKDKCTPERANKAFNSLLGGECD